MEIIATTIIGIIIGGIITYFVSREFYEKTKKTKSLEPFVRFVTTILSSIDPEVKKQLKVFYDKCPVEKLYQIEFVIANTGDIPIFDIIKPLSLLIPNKGQILDVNLFHIEPRDRDVAYKISNDGNFQRIDFIFPLLNPGEYFIFKLLVKGDIPKIGNKEGVTNWFYEYYDEIISEFKFSITAPDLKPSLSSRRLPYYYEEEHNFTDGGLDLGAVFGLAIGLLLSLSMIYMLYHLKNISAGYFLFNFKEFFTSFNLMKLTVIIGWLASLFLMLITIISAIDELSKIKKKPKPKFRLPKKKSNFSYKTLI